MVMNKVNKIFCKIYKTQYDDGNVNATAALYITDGEEKMMMIMMMMIMMMLMMVIFYKVVLWACTGRTVKRNVHKIANKDDATSRTDTVLTVKMALRGSVVMLVK